MIDLLSRELTQHDALYKVEKNESYGSIAQIYLGSDKYWELLYYFNCRTDVVAITNCKPLAPNLLYQGQMLLLPDEGDGDLKTRVSEGKTIEEKSYINRNNMNNNFLSMPVDTIFRDGINYSLPDAPGITYESPNFQLVMKYSAGTLNVKPINKNDFSINNEHIYANAESFVDKIKESFKDIFHSVIKSASFSPQYELKDFLEFKNWKNGTVLIPKKVTAKYDLGALHSEMSAKKGSYKNGVEYFDPASQTFSIFHAATGGKWENYFCAVEFNFDTPPLMLGPNTLLFKASASGNMGGCYKNFELNWKGYGADLNIILKTQSGGDNFSAYPTECFANGFITQNSVEQYILSNYGVPHFTPSLSSSQIYLDPGARAGAEIAEAIATKRMSEQDTIILGTGIVASIVVVVGFEIVISSGILSTAWQLISNGEHFLTRALAGMISFASEFSEAQPSPELRESPETMTGEWPEATEQRVREMQLTAPGVFVLQGKKSVPLELVLASQGKLMDLKNNSKAKKTQIEFKIKK